MAKRGCAEQRRSQDEFLSLKSFAARSVSSGKLLCGAEPRWSWVSVLQLLQLAVVPYAKAQQGLCSAEVLVPCTGDCAV